MKLPGVTTIRVETKDSMPPHQICIWVRPDRHKQALEFFRAVFKHFDNEPPILPIEELQTEHYEKEMLRIKKLVDSYLDYRIKTEWLPGDEWLSFWEWTGIDKPPEDEE